MDKIAKTFLYVSILWGKCVHFCDDSDEVAIWNHIMLLTANSHFNGSVSPDF